MARRGSTRGWLTALQLVGLVGFACTAARNSDLDGGPAGSGGSPGTGGAAAGHAGTGGAAAGHAGTGGAVTGSAGTGGAAAGHAGTAGGGTGGSGAAGSGTAGTGAGGTGTGGTGTGGAGGTTGSCQCPAHQTCKTPGAACTCVTDPVCGAGGPTCSSSSLLANCAQDANGCFYSASSSTCTNGACTGAAGAASCCTNACTVGAICATSTSVQTCAVGSNGCAAAATSSCASGLVCERPGGAVCADPNWAEWPVPNDAPDVRQGAPNPEGYTDNQDGTVSDKVTGLMWQQTISSATFAQAAAVQYCPTLTLGGHSDWRLPSIIELASLIDFSVPGTTVNPVGAISGGAFPNTPAASFWSANVEIDTLGGAYFSVNFADGSTNAQGSGVADYVRCVR
jgi:hypothetical protein